MTTALIKICGKRYGVMSDGYPENTGRALVEMWDNSESFEQFKSELHDVFDLAGVDFTADYTYIFMDNEWHVCRDSLDDARLVRDVLKGLVEI